MAAHDEPLARLNAHLGFDSGSVKQWMTRVDMPGENQRVWVFRYDAGGVTQLAAVGEFTPPWTVAVPNWGSLRRSKREREMDIVELYVGRAIHALRDPVSPTEAMLAHAEQVRLSALLHPQAEQAEVIEVVRVPKCGGVHVVIERLMETGRSERVNQRERCITPSSKVIAERYSNAMWVFLAMEFLPQRRWGAVGWG